MKNTFCFTLLFVAIIAFGATTGRAGKIVERDTLRKTLHFTGAAEGRRVLADLINGSMQVTGYDGNEIQLVAVKTIRAESESRMERAKKEVTLDIREDNDRVLIYVEAPSRREDGSSHDRGWNYEGYEVEYYLELRVPRKTDFYLKTVNGDNIEVSGMQGYFEVSNVNGDVEMLSIAGSGKVSTVNGNVGISFTKNPVAATSFKTLNGEIEVKFPSTPSADIRFKTMNGEVYTDFDVKNVSTPVTGKKKRRGKNVYGGGESFGVQAGGGGPEMSLSTLNGNIYLSLKGEKK